MEEPAGNALAEQIDVAARREPAVCKPGQRLAGVAGADIRKSDPMTKIRAGRKIHQKVEADVAGTDEFSPIEIAVDLGDRGVDRRLRRLLLDRGP